MLIINTGDGKGKTSSALGVILRSLAINKKVLLVQFMKPVPEKSILFLQKQFPGFKVYNFGIEKFVRIGAIPKELLKICYNGFETLNSVYADYDLIVVDEIFTAMHFNLIDKKEFLDFVTKIKDKKDIILTGRKCPLEFVSIADIVTEMKNVKHHYDKGTLAKEGIDF